jgi:UDP:flavonoid glycosyltransferase YjiC (YdhE family)
MLMSTTDKKPLLLIFPFGLLSHYLRCLVLCRYLRKHFEIKIANNPTFASFITQEAFESFECDSLDADCIIKAVKKFDFSWLNPVDLERVFVEQVNTIRTMKPLAVLGDHSITLKMAAEKTGVYYISLINGYMSKYYAGTRDISRTHPAYPFVKMLPGSLPGIITKQGERIAFRHIHRPFSAMREKYHLRHQHTYLDEMEGDLTLICDLPEFFPQAKTPSEYLQLSPLIYSQPCLHNGSFTGVNPSKKTIFASMGSSGDWEKISFLNHPVFKKYNVIASGDNTHTLHASHILHTPFVDIDTLFSSIDLVICHGGNGTIYQALLYGIPALCCSSHCEQEWNVSTIEKHHLGKSLNEVFGLESLVAISDEWIGKKGNRVLTAYREKIVEEVSRLPIVAEAIANRILEKGQQQNELLKKIIQKLPA